MKVVNVKGMKANSPGVYYCGRPTAGWKGSVLANWHRIDAVCKECEQNGKGLLTHTREQAIEAFKRDLWAAIKRQDDKIMRALCEIIEHQDDIALGCWCAPEACHCDVIVAASGSKEVIALVDEWWQRQQPEPEGAMQ